MEMDHPSTADDSLPAAYAILFLDSDSTTSNEEGEDQLSDEAVQKEASTNNVLFWFTFGL